VTIEITNGRIASIYPSATRRSRATSELDLSGLFVMPGLFDSHVHLTMGGRPAPAIQLRLVLEGGVTSVRDMAGLVPALRRLAAEAQVDSVLSPRIHFAALVAGPSWFDDPRAKWWTADYALGAAPWQHAVNDTSDVAAIVAAAKATGATAIKIYANLSRRLVERLAAEARRQDLRVWAHSTVFPASPFDVVGAGVHSVAHATYAVWAESDSLPAVSRGSLNLMDLRPDPADSPRIDSLLTAMRESGTVLDATRSVLNVRNDNQGALGQDPSRTIAWTRAFTRRAHAMGVRIVAGTDAMGPGRDSVPIVHYELEDLVQYAGLTPIEAIATATVNAAEMLGIAADYGSVAPGKVADLVVLVADPSTDIRNTRRPLMVLKGGRVVHTRRHP
jgi:imidazolonepropionase-like amidohydrolase